MKDILYIAENELQQDAMIKGHECGTHACLTLPGFVSIKANRVHSLPPQEVLFPGWMDGSSLALLCMYKSWSDVVSCYPL